MRNKLLIFLLIFISFLTFSTLNAQVIPYKNLKKVAIVDPTQLYYDYPMMFSDWERTAELVNNDQKAVEHIRTFGFETGWPENLKSIDWRIAHPEVIKSLVAFYIGVVSGDFLSLLIIPNKENKVALKKVNVVLENDIYMLIPTESIKWID